MPLLGKPQHVRLNLTAAGTQVIAAAPGAGLQHVVLNFGFVADAVTADPQFESNTTIIAGPFRDTLGFVGASGTRDAPLFECLPNEALEFVTAGAGNASGYVTFLTTIA